MKQEFIDLAKYHTEKLLKSVFQKAVIVNLKN